MKALALSVLWVLPLALGSCKSAEEKLTEGRIELRDLEEQLFKQYGGSDVAEQVDQKARAAAQNAEHQTGDLMAGLVGEVLGNAARGMDREMFSQDCRRLGRGETVQFLTDKGRKFFEKPETRETCAKIAKVADEVSKLEVEVGGGSGAPPGSAQNPSPQP